MRKKPGGDRRTCRSAEPLRSNQGVSGSSRSQPTPSHVGQGPNSVPIPLPMPVTFRIPGTRPLPRHWRHHRRPTRSRFGKGLGSFGGDATLQGYSCRGGSRRSASGQVLQALLDAKMSGVSFAWQPGCATSSWAIPSALPGPWEPPTSFAGLIRCDAASSDTMRQESMDTRD
jgi:hypothetical protein